MSTEEKFSLGGHSLKEWAFIILMINLSVVIGSYAVVFWVAVTNSPESIVISGTIDISQIVIIVFGIAMVATVLVSQKLTKDGVIEATRNTDEVWMKDKP
jgi:cell division septal protein FtsQ